MHSHFAWFGEACKEHSYGKVKGKGVIFLTAISNVNNLCHQEAWN
jgi:hypothetical protein